MFPNLETSCVHNALLLQEQFCTNLPLSNLLRVRQTECELVAPQPLSNEEHIRFVSSLALSVDVQATIRNVPDREHLAVQVGNFAYMYYYLSVTTCLMGTQQVKHSIMISLASYNRSTPGFRVSFCVRLCFLTASDCCSLSRPPTSESLDQTSSNWTPLLCCHMASGQVSVCS